MTVAVVTFKPFYVLGEATTPGEYPFEAASTCIRRSRWRADSPIGRAGLLSSYGTPGMMCGRNILLRTRADCAWRFNSSARKIFLGGRRA